MLSQDAEHHSESQPGCSALLPVVKPQLPSVMLGKLIKTSWEKKKMTSIGTIHSVDSQDQNHGTNAQSAGY